MEEIRISRHVLWIGGEAYSLRNIACASVSVLPLDSSEVFKKATRLTRGLAGVCFIPVVIAITVNGWWDGPLALVILGTFMLVSWIIIGSVGGAAVVRAKRNPHYTLSIQPSGRPGVALVSKDRSALQELMRRIMDTIDNPESEFRIQVNNVQHGDRINQVGDFNVGKVAG
jgi:Family of unknown function (DUF6232)